MNRRTTIAVGLAFAGAGLVLTAGIANADTQPAAPTSGLSDSAPLGVPVEGLVQAVVKGVDRITPDVLKSAPPAAGY